MFKILLPVDFSENTDNTCQYALALAAAMPAAHILLLHCFHDNLADADYPLPPAEDLTASEAVAERVIHRNEIESQDLMEELYRNLKRDARTAGTNIKVERTFMYGAAEDKIPDEISRFKPDLVIMGTKGESGITRSFFGTVTTKIVEAAQVPLLTVPRTYTGGIPAKVLYATDFDSSDAAALEALQRLLQEFNSEIYCVHISENEKQQEVDKLQELQQQLTTSTSGSNLHYTLLEGGNVADAIEDLVQREQFGLVALTTRERTLLGSILNPSLAKKMVLNALVPILIFHSNEKA
ncbi:universal stress protein [Pontibacter harenae]|uniref:universal stress protein n=1 Tax=Pontibacter harenae TaxID=2894083 RepID=UPI001E595EB9|nr:universal stress protein [Pontibacter harenae]MCC9168735.1 universal stress protein [Pontibacter harenae]